MSKRQRARGVALLAGLFAVVFSVVFAIVSAVVAPRRGHAAPEVKSQPDPKAMATLARSAAYLRSLPAFALTAQVTQDEIVNAELCAHLRSEHQHQPQRERECECWVLQSLGPPGRAHGCSGCHGSCGRNGRRFAAAAVLSGGRGRRDLSALRGRLLPADVSRHDGAIRRGRTSISSHALSGPKRRCDCGRVAVCLCGSRLASQRDQDNALVFERVAVRGTDFEWCELET